MFVINGLLIKWGITDAYDYEYRLSGRALHIKLLDLKELSGTLLSLGTIWLSIRVLEKPLSGIVETVVRQNASILQNSLTETISLLLYQNI
jgi:hypothetical protein